MEVAPRYKLLTLLTLSTLPILFTLFIMFKLLHAAEKLAIMPIYTIREGIECYWKGVMSCC